VIEFCICDDLQVDIAYIPFVERFQIFLSDVSKYDITAGRPKLAKWIEVHCKTIRLLLPILSQFYSLAFVSPIELVC
jgi:hypothetical protein